MKGGLRLDSYELLMKGGKDGPVIVAGRAGKSLLLERVTLPPDQKQFMPAEGRPPLKPEEIAWIRAWIQQGASPAATSLAGIAIGEEPKEQPLQPVGEYSGLMPEIRQMEKGQGAKLMQVSSKPSDGLILNTADVARKLWRRAACAVPEVCTLYSGSGTGAHGGDECEFRYVR